MSTSTAKVSSADVKAYLKEIVEFGDAFYVDEQSYVIAKVKNEKIPFKGPDGTTRFLTIYDPMQQNTDVLVFNPFVEGLDETADKQWFYLTRSMTLSGIIYRIMESVIKHVLSAKDKKDAKDLDTSTAKLISKYVAMEGIDGKILLELDTIAKNLSKFFNIFFSRKDNSSCRTNIGIFEENFRNSFGGKVRKRSWVVFEKIISDILGTTNPKEDFKHHAQVAGCPHLDSYMRTYVHVIKKMQKFWYLQNKKVDLKSLEKHVENLGLYYNIARHYAGPAARTNAGMVDTSKPVSTTAPWETPKTPGFPGIAAPTSGGMPFAPANAVFSPAGDPNIIPIAQGMTAIPPMQQNPTMPFAGNMPTMPVMGAPVMQQMPQVPMGYPQQPYAQMPYAPMQNVPMQQPVTAPQYPMPASQPMLCMPPNTPVGMGMCTPVGYQQNQPVYQGYPGYPGYQQNPQQAHTPQMMIPTASGIMVETPLEVSKVVASSPLI